MYEPLRVFGRRSACLRRLGAVAAWSPFVLDVIINGDSTGHVQSLDPRRRPRAVAVQMFALGIIGDTLAGQRVIAQRIFERVRRIELRPASSPRI